MPIRIIRNWWYVDIRHMRTRYRKRSPSNNPRDAARYEQALRRELAVHGCLDHMYFPRARRLVLLEDLTHRWLREYVRVNNRPCVLGTNTSALYSRIIPVLGNKPINEIDVRDIDRLKSHFIGLGHSAKTINNYLGILHRCLRSAVEWNLLDQVPRIKMLKAAPPGFKFLELEEAKRLVQAAPTGYWRTMVVIALQTGLRASEIQGLEWGDVDLPRRVLQVRRGVVRGHVAPPKSNRMRYIALTDGVIRELARLPKCEAEARVFPMPPYTNGYAHIRRALRRITDAAGLPKEVGWHTLRHSFASHLVSAGAPLKVVQEALGHASYEMTLRYAHLSPNTMHEAMKLLPGLISTERSFEIASALT